MMAVKNYLDSQVYARTPTFGLYLNPASDTDGPPIPHGINMIGGARGISGGKNVRPTAAWAARFAKDT